MASCIEDYAMIGDCETAALIGRDGSVDWLCWPRFDSAACFAAMLGTSDNGRWLIAPDGPTEDVVRRYRPDTLVLETLYRTLTGSAAVIDFMPVEGGSSALVRIVEGRTGSVSFRTELVVRFDYGAAVPWVTRNEDGSIQAVAGPELLVLRTGVPMRGEDLRTVGEFTVGAGQSVAFTLSYCSSFGELPPAIDAFEALRHTETFWSDWTGRCRELGPYFQSVKRSLITLKALTYRRSGGIVAAATTSLPEQPGGVRNWDYRFCWLRDATFALLAFMNLGYHDEASAWRDWLIRAVAGSPRQIQIMYGVGGERRLPEWTVPWLPGYEGSAPVRVGNDAYRQLQIDIFGEVADVMFQALKVGLRPPERAYRVRAEFLDHLADHWREPDEGIWEVRSGRRHFVHSKLMSWVAFDRAANEVETAVFADSASRWRQIADEIHHEICARGFDAEIGNFVQSYGSKRIDASLLLIPLVGFLPADDPRVRGTVREIERRLLVDDEFVLRYEPDNPQDGLPSGEGALLACSFWLVDNYVLQGRREEARKLFERLLARCNDVGLLSEEIDPVTGRMLGNFPQAYSHVGLINSALHLAQIDGPGLEPSRIHTRHAPIDQTV